VNRKRVFDFIFCAFIILLLSFNGGCGKLLPESYMGLPAIKQPLTTRIYYNDGELMAQHYVENRIEVSLEDIPEEVVQATIATEDKNFFRHFGLDFAGIIRAAYYDFKNKKISQGGSTISQQLAKNLFLSHERTWERKIKELFLTLRLEQVYSKGDILEKYLNTIYYGHAAYGIEAAAETYFGKKASELNLSESAMLAGLPRGPLYYSPFLDMDAARKRQAHVLGLMEAEGYISAAEKKKALAQPILLKPPDSTVEAGYLVDYIINTELVDLWEQDSSLLSTGGLEIHTSLDPRMQSIAEKIMKEKIPVSESDQEGISQPQGALVAIDPLTGYIRAMVGGKDYTETMFNRVFSLRSPGSAFKPFVYAAALENGYTAASRFHCEPTEFWEEGMDAPYRPADFGNTFHYDTLTMREAISQSCNVIAVKLNAEIGNKKSMEMAHRLGIRSPIGDYLSLPLGTSEVTLMEMASAFAPFANGGFRIEPMAVKKVIDREGKVVWETEPERQPVLDEGIAYIMTDMMKGVFREGGTGFRAAHLLDRPVAGKTGTSSNTKDAYTIGYTPDLVAGVYIGHDQGKSLGADGGRLAAPLWAEFITGALKDTPPRDFSRPPAMVEVSICPHTGLKQSPWCQAEGYTELFVEGTEPEQSCSYPECHSTPIYPWWPWWR